MIMLVESPRITRKVDANWVRKTAFKGGDKFTEEECRVVAKLANDLRPFAPKKTEGQGEDPAPHVARYAALVRIANILLDGTGYGCFCQKDSPIISPASLHGLALGSVGLYEALCAQEPGHFDIRDARNDPLTDYKDVTGYLPNKRAVFCCVF